MAGPPRIDYGSQVRLFALLLFLLLLVLLLGSTYLYGQARGRLEAETERSLLLAARSAADRVEADPWWREAADPQRLADETAASLEALRAETGLSRLVVWDPRGRPRVFGPAVPPPEASAAEPALRDGRPVLSDFLQAEERGYRRAYTLPLRAGGRPAGAVTAEVRSDFLGMLHRVRWVILLSYGLGVGLALVFSLLFVRSVLKPYATLSSAARDFQRLAPAASPAAAGDVEFVTQTFQRMIDVLKAKEEELSRLYAAEQERAQRLEQYQEDILGSMTSGVVSCRPDGSVVVFNKTAQQIFGLRADDALGRPFGEVFGPDSRLARVMRDGLGRQRTYSRLEFSLRRADGAARWVGLSSSVLRDKAGQILGYTVLLTDLTEIVFLRRQVVLKESLATLGEMSAGIAHEFRNSLGAIRGFARLAQKTLAEEGEAAGNLHDVLVEIARLEAVLKEFLSFARPVSLQPAPVAVAGLVEEALAHCREEIQRAGIALARFLPPEPVEATLDAALVRQALVNLIRNATEAMPGGGTLTVGAGATRREGEEGPEDEGEGREAWVEFLVADTGPGIPEKDRERIFTPFFTTKDHGTGLGLAQVQKTVVAHGGRVEVETAVGAGSLFRVLLPQGERRAAPRI